MKMKSKFFGLSAKLALAVLAVGTTLTSCYDSENGDVNKPYTPEAPKYIVSGYITDYETGEPLTGATVTIGAQQATTNGGAYSLELTAPGALDVTIAAEGYSSVERSLQVETITTGVALYTVDAALWDEAALPGIKVEVMDNQTASNQITAEEAVAVDLVNNDEQPIPASLTFNNLQAGATFVSDYTTTANATKAASDDPREAFIAYCEAYLGVNPDKGFTKTTQEFNFMIAGRSSVKSVTINTYGATERYIFTLNGVEHSYVINRITGYALVPEVVSNEIYHGHGHGHGHGGELNAGGGIWE